jgi:predicted Rossmann-fold nucleotide-binding protein
LIGTAYWGGLFDWMRDVVLTDGKVSPRDLEIFHVTDDLDKAVDLVVAARAEHAQGGEPESSEVAPQPPPRRPE